MNTLSKTVKQFLDECRQSIDKRGDLPSSKRKEIYEMIELHSNTKHTNLGHYRRAKLELMCAWKTFDKWEDCPLTDNLARELLELAEKYLRGEVEKIELEKKSSNFYTIVDDLICKGEEYLSIAYAGFACNSAINAVLYDIDFDSAGISEREKEPEDWTACFNACDAYSNAKSWELKDSNISKRREFWEWFLSEAVPAVWNAYPDKNAEWAT
jgi:hypothetical protein